MGKIHEKVTTLFPTKSLQVGDAGQRRQHHIIACSNCPAEGTSPVAVSSGGLGLPELIRRFTRQGWYVGRVHGAHICPDCNTTKQRAVLTVVPDNDPEPQEEAPVAIKRELSFSDRRIINTKLEETYENDIVGYRPGWTDASVAKDLGVDETWVAELRGLNFGPAAGNVLLTEIRAEQAALRKEGEALMKRIKLLDEKMASSGLKLAA